MKVITVARKPLAGSVAQTALKYGTGGLNIDGCRIPVDLKADSSQLRTMNRNQKEEPNGWGMNQNGTDTPVVVSLNGRWPANLILQHQPECQVNETESIWDCVEGCPVSEMSSYGVTKSNVIKTEKKPYEGESNTGFLRGVTNHQNHHDDSGYVSRFFKQVKATQEPSFRAEGRILCLICGKAYVLHPDDAEEPYLTRLCDGTFVKL